MRFDLAPCNRNRSAGAIGAVKYSDQLNDNMITRATICATVTSLLQWADRAGSSVLARLSAWAWGISVGRRCIFYGLPRFYLRPGSRMRIGSACRFRSGPRSSFAGVYRACMLTTLYPEASIEIGERCGLSGNVIVAAKSIRIGDDCLLGANAVIMDTDWHHPDPNKRNTAGPTSPVVIGRNVWIGMNSMVFKGVVIGDNSIIAAGSVVTKSIPADVVAGGIPARVLRQIASHEVNNNP